MTARLAHCRVYLGETLFQPRRGQILEVLEADFILFPCMRKNGVLVLRAFMMKHETERLCINQPHRMIMSWIRFVAECELRKYSPLKLGSVPRLRESTLHTPAGQQSAEATDILCVAYDDLRAYSNEVFEAKNETKSSGLQHYSWSSMNLCLRIFVPNQFYSIPT
jgi:hypothetical protein